MVPYFISFRTYGTWLHGDERGSTDREHNRPGAPFLPPDPERAAYERGLMKGEPVVLDDRTRSIVTRTVQEVCAHRAWTIHSLNVRTNHVHIVVTADQTPERVMNDLKAWSTRRLREAGCVGADASVWAYHGSTRYLNTDDSFMRACLYVSELQ